MERLKHLEKRLAIKRKDYDAKFYFGRLSDLLADIVSLEVQIERTKDDIEKGRKDIDGNLDVQ